MDLKQRFEAAVEQSKNLSSRPDNQTLLQLYGLFKQASLGDNPGEKPSNPFDIVGRAKYEAWAKWAGTSAEDAMTKYLEIFEKLKSA
jgi:diazepam-binding inhibitor (GABA receptor modulator, acyl-CoA-binding protein)